MLYSEETISFIEGNYSASSGKRQAYSRNNFVGVIASVAKQSPAFNM
jgi:hypothetical protein